MKRFIFIIALIGLSTPSFAAKGKSDGETIDPSGTYLFAQRDTCALYLDVYDPAEGSETSVNGVAKPTVVFVFGGGFSSGQRNKKHYRQWFKKLTDNGIRAISIDYRLGMKGVKAKGMEWVQCQEKAINMAAEDLLSATKYILDNAEALGVNPDGIVISGSSAGAITALQADWILCNRGEAARILPEDFHYAGVMAFSGAVFSSTGAIRYAREPAPTLFFHGTDDKVVNYGFTHVLKYHFDGADALSKLFSKRGYNYNIYRFKGNSHEIAVSMTPNFEEEMKFILNNVMQKKKRIIDATVSDPSFDPTYWKTQNVRSIY